MENWWTLRVGHTQQQSNGHKSKRPAAVFSWCLWALLLRGNQSSSRFPELRCEWLKLTHICKCSRRMANLQISIVQTGVARAPRRVTCSGITSAESRGLWGVTERREARKPLMRVTKGKGYFLVTQGLKVGRSEHGWWQAFVIKSWLQLDLWGISMNLLELEITFIWYGWRDGVLDREVSSYEIHPGCFMVCRNEKSVFGQICAFLVEKRVSQLNENKTKWKLWLKSGAFLQHVFSYFTPFGWNNDWTLGKESSVYTVMYFTQLHKRRCTCWTCMLSWQKFFFFKGFIIK